MGLCGVMRQRFVLLFCSDGFQTVWRHKGEEYNEKRMVPTVKHAIKAKQFVMHPHRYFFQTGSFSSHKEHIHLGHSISRQIGTPLKFLITQQTPLSCKHVCVHVFAINVSMPFISLIVAGAFFFKNIMFLLLLNENTITYSMLHRYL